MINPKISLLSIVILSAAGTVSELGYAVEGAYAIPVLLEAGISLKYASIMLSLSPVIGIIVQSFVGSASDQCKCAWGRRKPFILLFGLIAVICCGSLPYYFYIDWPQYQKYAIPACIVLCIMLFDLSIGTLLIPARAYMLDIIPQSQENIANLLTSAGVGVFTSLGFGLGAVNWPHLLGKEHSVEKQSQIVFGLTAGLLLIVILLALLALKETNTNVQDADHSIMTNETDDLLDSMKSCDKYGIEDNLINADTSDKKETSKSCCCANPCILLKDSTVQSILFFYNMSRHMWILFLTFMMAFAAEFSFTYSFSIFVGTVVYGGDSKAPRGSDSYLQYTKGVRMGSLAFAIGCFANIFISLVLGKLIKYLKLKLLFLIIVAVFTCCTCLLMYFHQVPAVMVLGSILGPYMGVCVAVPYGLVAVYMVS